MKELTHHTQLTLTGIWDILSEIGLPSSAKGLSVPAAIHDSCGARGNSHIQQTVRKLVSETGCELVDTPCIQEIYPLAAAMEG